MHFGNYALPKTQLEQCLKSPFLEDPSKRNMVNAPKHCSKLKDSTFTILLITGKSVVLQKVSISDMKNLKTVS